MAQQLGTVVESATAPHQYALKTRAGCECIAHALQGLCDVDHLDRWHWDVRPNLSSCDVGGVDARGRRRSGDSLRPFVLRIAILLFVERFFWHHPQNSPKRGWRARRSVNATPLLAALQAIDSDLNDNESYSHSWTTSTLSQPRTGWERCTSLSTNICGISPESASTEERHRCGTRLMTGRTSATRWNALPGLRTQMFGSGRDQSCQWFNRGSKSSAPLWDIRLSWKHISTRRLKNKHCFLNGSQLSLMCNLRGLSCFIVPRHRTLNATMRVCGSVCVRYLTWTQNLAQSCGRQLQCRCVWAALG